MQYLENDIIYDIPEMGYVFEVNKNKFEIRIHAGPISLLMGSKKTREEAITFLKRLDRYRDVVKKTMRVTP